MEGPTPVSALIHAATMVTAGVYLVSRMHSLFILSDTAMVTIAVTGIATALFAATIGLMQNDIKRVLAYSTVSQLGYMFAACGAGVFAAGMFHVMTHAFFKACLFLGSGSVIHAIEHGMHHDATGTMTHADAAHAEHGDSADEQTGGVGGPDPHDPQDMRNMGGLFGRITITAVTMIAATLAIAGIIPVRGLLEQGRNPLARLADRAGRQLAVLGRRRRDGADDCVLYVPAGDEDVLRRAPHGRRQERAGIQPVHDAAAGDPGGPGHHHRLGRAEVQDVLPTIWRPPSARCRKPHSDNMEGHSAMASWSRSSWSSSLLLSCATAMRKNGQVLTPQERAGFLPTTAATTNTMWTRRTTSGSSNSARNSPTGCGRPSMSASWTASSTASAGWPTAAARSCAASRTATSAPMPSRWCWEFCIVLIGCLAGLGYMR